MSDCDVNTCTVRSFLELRISKDIALLHEEIRAVSVEVQHEKELRDNIIRFLNDALALQAKEYERRLELLNNEHGRVALAQATYVSKESYDREMEADRLWKNNKDKSEATAKGASERTMVLFAVIITLINLALNFIPL